MIMRLLADALVMVHLLFILFVIAGAAIVLWHRWLAAFHLPALCWGVWIEFSGSICPLTPLEQQLRLAAGESGYEGGFIEHYLIPLIYPAQLDREIQLLLGISVLVVNSVLYLLVLRRIRAGTAQLKARAGT